MKQDLPNERLEEFLRQQLGDYTENPPESVWSGIADHIPAPVVSAPVVRLGFYRWAAIGATVVAAMLAIRLCQLEMRIDKLEQEKQVQAAPVQPAVPTTVAPHPSATVESVAVPKPKTDRPFSSTRPQQADSPNFEKNIQTPAVAIHPPTLPPGSNPDAVANDTAKAAAVTVEKPTTPLTILPLYANRLLVSKPEQPVFTNHLIKPVQKNSRWAVTALSMPLWVEESIKFEADRLPGKPPRGHVPEEIQQNATGWRSGLLVARSFNSSLALVSGLTYRETKQGIVHEPRLEFQDGKPGAPVMPGQKAKYAFDYQAYGSAASSRVTVQVESKSPGQMPKPKEDIHLELKLQERTQILEMPLGVQLQPRWGRIQAITRLGVTGEYFIQQVLKVESIELENTNDFNIHTAFKPEVKSDPYRRFNASSWVSAGLSVNLTERLSLGAEGWWTKQLFTHAKDNAVLPTEQTLGAGLSLRYQL